jgi:hypothetical protein
MAVNQAHPDVKPTHISAYTATAATALTRSQRVLEVIQIAVPRFRSPACCWRSLTLAFDVPPKFVYSLLGIPRG